MRSNRSVFGTASSQRIDCQSEPVETPTRTFTPSQQLAMLILRKTSLSKAVVAKLRNSTVRASELDFQFLVTERLALHNGMGRVLTPMGRYLADRHAHELAKEFELPILRTGRPLHPRGSYQRQWHTTSWTQ